ncbi:MAG: hydantoinase/oxoprolinase family protein [Immundisolibacterales bacterium]|nr:hydantoinase/oxoprolinase family protein [Immundisolibacterales bacterium]
MWALGIDIGGTFTDIVARSGERTFARKILTTHDNPARGVEEGVAGILADARLDPGAVERLVHATTLFTNTLIERKGARTGLITTRGFRDTLEIGRERKYELYDLTIAKPAPLVPRERRLEATERVGARGEVLEPLDPASLDEAMSELARFGVEAVAIAFLHAYANPEHERTARDLLSKRFPALPFAVSSEVAPEIREFERISTTVANAYLMPLAASYVDRLADRIAARGIGSRLLLMLSSGGLTDAEEARRFPVRMLESGPAAGAIAAAWFGGRAGHDDLLAFDMGGTTAKLCLVDGGEPLVTHTFEACRERRFIPGSGLPLKISALELIEIGAGGGSIARVDELGLLKVGPESAGSEPGPACYGRGGRDPTVTDADLVLGYLDPAFFAGGDLRLRPDAAAVALASLEARSGLAGVDLARGIFEVVTETMASAARVHIAERGRDPRRYVLLATGGAGPVHGWYLAARLGIGRVVCPPSAGVASALGLLLAPARADRVATVAEPLDSLDWNRFEATYRRIEEECRSVLAHTGLDPDAAEVARSADLRFRGQDFELVVELPAGPYIPASEAGIAEAFRAAYERAFSRVPPGVDIEVVNIRVAVRAGGGGAREEADDGVVRRAPRRREVRKGTRPAYFPEHGRATPTPVFDRYALRPGDGFPGPAIVEERESTAVVGPGGRFEIDGRGNLVMSRLDDAEAGELGPSEGGLEP